jgi:hypothetical protein
VIGVHGNRAADHPEKGQIRKAVRVEHTLPGSYPKAAKQAIGLRYLPLPVAQRLYDPTGKEAILDRETVCEYMLYPKALSSQFSDIYGAARYDSKGMATSAVALYGRDGARSEASGKGFSPVLRRPLPVEGFGVPCEAESGFPESILHPSRAKPVAEEPAHGAQNPRDRHSPRSELPADPACSGIAGEQGAVEIEEC